MMLLVCIASFLVSGAVYGSPLVQADGGKEGRSLKIINGAYTTIDQFPIEVAVLIANDIWGAGAIVGNNWIMTTAFNCFWVDASYISVRVGSSNCSQDGTVIQAEKCFIHPNYTGNWANNIALIRLTKNITMSKNAKLGIYKPAKSLKIAGASYNVSGWGVRSSNYSKEFQLQFMSQTILNDTECSKTYNVTGGNFCAVNSEGGPCVFDFGAPMSKKRKIVGMYQGSMDCTQPDVYPANYVDVISFRDWIDDTIANN